MTSVEFSKATNMPHFSVNRLIDLYREELETFGHIETKKITPDKGTKGGRPLEFLILNESHINLLTTFLKNTENGIRLKVEMIKKLNGGET